MNNRTPFLRCARQLRCIGACQLQLHRRRRAMPLRPFAPSDNASARPDAVAALAALLKKRDAKASPDVDAFLDIVPRAPLTARQRRPAAPRRARADPISATQAKCAAAGGLRARVFRSGRPRSAKRSSARRPCIDELAAFAPILARHLDAALHTLAFLAACDRRIAGALVDGDDAPLLQRPSSPASTTWWRCLRKHACPTLTTTTTCRRCRQPPPPPPRQRRRRI